VDQVEVDVEQVGLALGPPYDVLLPDLLSESATHLLLLLVSQLLCLKG
jgi:hypothetical protein